MRFKKLNNPFLLLTLGYLLICLIGIWFLVSSWLPTGYILAGHDSGLALDSKMFLKTRSYAWDERVNFGIDNSNLFGSLTIHLFDYLSTLFTDHSYAGNKFNVFFWLGALFIAGIIFAYQLKDRLGNYFVYIFPIFIVFNFYIFQSLFILERAKYGILIAILLFLTLTFKVLEKKIPIIIAAILSSLTFFIFNGGGILGLPLYGGLLVIVFVFLVFLLIKAILSRNFNGMKRIIVFLIFTFIFHLILNLYAFLPYTATFFSSDRAILTDSLTVAGSINWVDYISQGSTFLNLLRFQGVPDWFLEKYTPNSMNPYATHYFYDPTLIFFSFLIPIIAFSSFIFIKTNQQRLLISFFGLLTLISIFFMAATRSPLGFIYEFLYLHIPGFVIFRSPYYKFGSALVIGISVLLGFSISSIILIFVHKFKNIKKVFGILLVVFIIIGWFWYHQYLLSPSIFEWRQDFSTRVSLPDYVEDFRKWSNQQSGFKRTLLIPPLNENWQSDGYEWGYWSFSTLYYALSKDSFLANPNSNDKLLLDKIYSEILNKNEDEVISIAQKLGVNYFILRKDVLQNKTWSASPNFEQYEHSLKEFKQIKKYKQFGKWDIYKINEGEFTQISTSSKITFFVGRLKLDLFDFTQDNDILLENKNIKFDTIAPYIDQTVQLIDCLSCVLEEENQEIGLVWSRILPNSLLYKLKIWKEGRELKNISKQDRLTTYYGLVLKRAADVEAMLEHGITDKYILDSLSRINQYLGEISNILQESRDPKSDYKLAGQLKYFLSTPESKFQTELGSFTVGNKSDKVREEFSLVLWNINQLKGLFQPFIGDQDKREREKVYDLKIPDDSKYKLFLKKDSLPLRSDGQYLQPEKISFNSLDSTISANLKIANIKWFEIVPEKLNSNITTLTLNFPPLPNLYQNQRNIQMNSPEGERMCIVGNINLFNNKKSYLLKFDAGPGQGIRIFARDSDYIKSEDIFKNWKDEKYYGIEFSRIIRTIIKSDSLVSPQVFICRRGENMPDINSIEIKEAFVTNIVGLLGYEDNVQKQPEIFYERINPTKYIVNIKNASNPYILKLNQSFNGNWELKFEKEQDKNEKLIHFQINLYANAWWIDRKGDYNLVIEYKPQKLFYKGVIISVVGLIVMITFLAYSLYKKKHE